MLFTLVALSVDNHTSNRNFYEKLICNGELKTSIPHLQEETKKMHLLFYPVHNFKNIYSCFLRWRCSSAHQHLEDPRLSDQILLREPIS
uniref:Uncharacterized protein n=1 Tax=Lepeophtheirus salmonis TaxID=72036 RepID=A0A0K2VJ10_LEPSM